MLVCLWSPKGGSGTSVVTAASALVLAREGTARIGDLTGDQAAVLGLPPAHDVGLFDWLRVGAQAPPDALDSIGVPIGRGVTLLPAGAPGIDDVPPEAGAALGVVLRDADVTTLCDAGSLDAPALAALNEVADASIVVVRGCYLALRRAVEHPEVARATGVIVLEEHGRALTARDVSAVLEAHVLCTVEVRASIAHAIDAGVLASRLPDGLAKPLRQALARVGCLDRERAA